MYIVTSYLLYLIVSVGVTVWVAATLHRNGRVFLVDAFAGNEPLADSVNHMLVVGFCLINAGFVTSVLRTHGQIDTLRAAVEMVSEKVGFALLVLGGMHFFNLYVFSRIRRRLQEAHEPPPLPASGYLPAGGRA
jgi:predicted histidine transporter YuiF (NhaC family)